MIDIKNMLETEFENYLHERIPITEEMSFKVEEFKLNKVRIGAKLKPNINHKSTAFGGSINSLTTVCGWALVFNNMLDIDPNAHIVIQKSSIQYLKPIETDFVAECELTDERKKEKFVNTFRKLGKARIEVDVIIRDGEEIFAQFKGYYVVFR
ncbi:YiiD C-terminal domain-containing protein [Tepidibacillus infernus]|uniref:YiiD C-terminal domain-containing protein n=1 Tax=Tepidibacillus TaxID=1494427 RepID=UPI000857D2B3|nr:YiiD C-terminal domain-containing protein [Tepidibacillus sp. HK-1]GBF10833.1 putative thioesterase [Tepidibacillus sp. HK-1]